MRKHLAIASLALALLLPASALADDIPEMTGTWEGTCMGHNAKTGFMKSTSQTWEVKEQKGPAFWGVKTFYAPLVGKDYSEKFSGTVTTGGVVRIGEHQDGTAVGTVEGDHMELQYVESGAKAKSVYCTLKKK